MTEEQKKKLEQKLWDIANTLRGKMNADEFRDYILGFIFFKYLSERMHLYANDVLKQDGMDYLSVNEASADGQAILDAVSEASVDALGYFLRPSELFSQIAKRGSKPGQFILADLTKILNNIQRSTMGTESEDDFDNLFEDLDLTSTKLGRTEEAKNTLIARVLTHLDEIDFQLDQADSDVLGDAYEYLIGQFASGAGKKAGEFYTPQQVSTILARIVTTGKTRLKSVYDPACGSGSLLLRVAKEADVSEFFGQEMNRTTYNLARMNMILHGVHYRNFDLKQEDTLEHPQHDGMRFEAVVANPPFSTKWSSNPLLLSDDRFSQYGKLAPASKADFAFVQHMLHHLEDNGTMAVILPHGALFRGGAEGHIRKYLIKDRNWLDAVIGLPANIFYGAAIPTCILVFKKCREWPEDILFVDASTYFEKAKNQNVLLAEHVDRITATYQSRAEEHQFSIRAPLAQVAENDYSLNIPRYVDCVETEAQIDLGLVARGMEAAEEVSKLAGDVIAKFCSELKIQPPMGSNLPSLETYKRGLMQALFSQRLRFTKPDGSAFPDWEKKKLNKVLRVKGKRNYDGKFDKSEVLSVSGAFGVVNQIEHLGRSYAGALVDNYHVVETGDIVYTKSPLKSNPYGIIKANRGKPGIVSTLYAVYEVLDGNSFDYIDRYFELDTNTNNYLAPLVNKGAKNDMKISNERVLIDPLMFPSYDEQVKIATALLAMNAKIAAISTQVTQMDGFKESLLRQMFV